MNHNAYKANRCTPLNSKNWESIKLECAPSAVRKVWLAQDNTQLIDLINDLMDDRYELSSAQLTSHMMALAYVRDKMNTDRDGVKATNTTKRAVINTLAGFHGVIYLGVEFGQYGKHLYMLNAGDTYAATLLFRGRSLSITTLGDLKEGECRKVKWAGDYQNSHYSA